MRSSPLCIGELVRMYSLSIIGVVVGTRRHNVYEVYIIRDKLVYTFPRSMLQKINKDKKCP